LVRADFLTPYYDLTFSPSAIIRSPRGPCSPRPRPHLLVAPENYLVGIDADLQESPWIVFRTGDLASLFELIEKSLQLAHVFGVMLREIPANPRVLE
jgi:hypothetical protein